MELAKFIHGIPRGRELLTLVTLNSISQLSLYLAHRTPLACSCGRESGVRRLCLIVFGLPSLEYSQRRLDIQHSRIRTAVGITYL